MNWRHFYGHFSQRWNCDEILKNKYTNQELKRSLGSLDEASWPGLENLWKPKFWLGPSRPRHVIRGPRRETTSRSPIPRATSAWLYMLVAFCAVPKHGYKLRTSQGQSDRRGRMAARLLLVRSVKTARILILLTSEENATMLTELCWSIFGSPKISTEARGSPKVLRSCLCWLRPSEITYQTKPSSTLKALTSPEYEARMHGGAVSYICIPEQFQ